MSDPIVLDVMENAGEVVTLSVPAHVRFARYISTLLSPATVSVPLVFLVAFYHMSNLLVPSIYASITLFFLSLGPLVYIVVGVRSGKLSDIDEAIS